MISNDSPTDFPQSWADQQALWQGPDTNGSNGLQPALASEPAVSPLNSTLKQLPGAKPASAPLHCGLSALGSPSAAAPQPSAPLAPPQAQPPRAHPGGYGGHQPHQHSQYQ